MSRAFSIAVTLVLSLAIACSSSPSSEAVAASLDKGSVLPALSLVGYVDRNSDAKLSPDEHGPLTPRDLLRDYPKVELVLVHVAFEWCKYCWEETAPQIAWTRHYGGRFVSMQVMVETRDGAQADRRLLDSWTKAHASALPTVLEPAGTLFAKFGKSATYLLLDARDDLRILAVGAGPPQFEAVRTEIAQRLGPMPDATPAH